MRLKIESASATPFVRLRSGIIETLCCALITLHFGHSLRMVAFLLRPPYTQVLDQINSPNKTTATDCPETTLHGEQPDTTRQRLRTPARLYALPRDRLAADPGPPDRRRGGRADRAPSFRRRAVGRWRAITGPSLGGWGRPAGPGPADGSHLWSSPSSGDPSRRPAMARIASNAPVDREICPSGTADSTRVNADQASAQPVGHPLGESSGRSESPDQRRIRGSRASSRPDPRATDRSSGVGSAVRRESHPSR